MEIKQLIHEYLEKARLMQVATSKDSQPWVCTVHFAYDEDLNLYWLSKPSTRHSQEIHANNKVAAAIVLQPAPGANARGLQLQGVAAELKGKDMEQGLNVYANRMKMKDERKQSILNGTDGHMVYQIKPTSFILFDEENFPDDPRQEYVL